MRINQILIDSGLMDSIGEYAYEEDNWEPVVTKFAELIVKESARFVSILDAEPMSHRSASILLLEHFGIEDE